MKKKRKYVRKIKPESEIKDKTNGELNESSKKIDNDNDEYPPQKMITISAYEMNYLKKQLEFVSLWCYRLADEINAIKDTMFE